MPGEAPPDIELVGMLNLLIGGGFDTTTALTAHVLEWLSEHPDERARLSRERDTLLNPATEEFLRFFTPAPRDGRTISDDLEVGMGQVILDRNGNRHFGFASLAGDVHCGHPDGPGSGRDAGQAAASV